MKPIYSLTFPSQRIIENSDGIPQADKTVAHKLEAAGLTLAGCRYAAFVLHTFGPAAIIRVKGECVSYQAPPCPLLTFIS